MRLRLWYFISMAAALVMVSKGAVAQEMRPPILVAQIEDKALHLKLARVGIEVRILGRICETKMTLTFSNPQARALAGDLYFPLPEGATVSGYALDIAGVMVDGVVVPKEKARQVFEKEVRRGVDPGLVEWVKGNNFKTRVFPIPAQGSRTVMVRYLSDLVQNQEGSGYYLPLRFKDPVEDFSLRVEVVKPVAPPQVKRGGLANFTFAQWRDSFVAETKVKNQAHNQDLLIALPEVDKKPAQVEKGPDGDFYFCLNDAPPASKEAAPAAPKSLTVYWDASGSRGKADHQRELSLLKDFLARQDAAPVKVDLVLFRHEAEKPRGFVIEKGNAAPLLEALTKVDYDGGTQLGSISPSPGAAVPDFYLLFTDGLSNFGKEEPTGFKAPVFVFSSDATANHAFLHYLAQKTGGEYFNLTRLSVDAVLPRIGAAPYSFISADFDPKQIDQTYPQTSQPVTGRFVLAGKLLAPQGKITLNYGVHGRVTHSLTYELSQDNAPVGNLVRLLYAQKKIEALQVFPKRHEKELFEAGRQYGLVTPGASLLVLENVRQYVEHLIPPPESLPEMRRQYVEMVEQKSLKEQQHQKDKLESVLALWQARVEWWNQKFTYPKDFKYEPPKPKKAKASRGGDALGVMALPREAAPAPGSPPMASMAPAPGAMKANDAGKEESTSTAEPSMAIKAWDPDTPYLKELKQAVPADYLRVYLEQRRRFGESPAFFVDCAEFFFQKKEDQLGLRVLSNIAEMELENPALLRVLAHKLAQQNYLELSRGVFEEVLSLRPEEPQSYRDLALVLDRLQQYQQAAALLYQVVTQDWDRFPEIEVIALMELNRIIAAAKRAGVNTAAFAVDPRLVKLLDLDLRIVLTWDADLTDMDLWVVEPSGEVANYKHHLTTIGGHVSRDVTDGYGPEEYVLKKAMKGRYQIKTNYYASRSPSLSGGVTLQVEVFTNYGRANEKRRAITLRLQEAKDFFVVGEVDFGTDTGAVRGRQSEKPDKEK
ncbi:MAG: VIT domain-containing protein [Desulfobaccales bacterium]